MDIDGSNEVKSEPRSYFVMIPNMAEDELDPFEYRLLAHYTRVCGQNGGSCYQSVKTIHDKTGISLAAVTKTRNSLQTKGYIKVTLPDGKARRGGENTSVNLVDRWQENTERYQQLIPFSDTNLLNQKSSAKELNQSIDSVFVPVQEELKEKELKQEKQTTTTYELPANSEQVAPAPVVVAVGSETLKVTVYAPKTQALPVPVATPAVLPSKAQQVTRKQQSAPIPNSAAPLPPPDEVIEAYDQRFTYPPLPNERAALRWMVDTYGVEFTIRQVQTVRQFKDSGEKINNPICFARTILEGDAAKGKKPAYVARAHSQDTPKEKSSTDPADVFPWYNDLNNPDSNRQQIQRLKSKQEVSGVAG